MNSKQVISLSIGLFLLLSIPVIIFFVSKRQELRKKAAPATSLEVKPASETIVVGEEFTKTIRIDTGENTVSAAVVEVLFDKTKLNATKIEAGDFITEILQAGTITEDKASITLGSGPGRQKKGLGTLAKITFQALEEGENIRMTLGPSTKVAGIDESTDVLTTRGVFGTVTITADTLGEPTATPTPPGATPTPTPTPIQEGEVTPTPTPTPIQEGEVTPTPIQEGEPTPTPIQGVGATPLILQKPSDGSVVQTTTPTFQGTASPGSTITIVIFSDPITGVVVADAQGRWSYTPAIALAEGIHTVQITEARLDGTTTTAEITITVQKTEPVPVSGRAEATIWIMSLGIGVLLMGILGIPFTSFR